MSLTLEEKGLRSLVQSQYNTINELKTRLKARDERLKDIELRPAICIGEYRIGRMGGRSTSTLWIERDGEGMQIQQSLLEAKLAELFKEHF